MLYFLKAGFPTHSDKKLPEAAISEFENLNGLLVLSSDTLETILNHKVNSLNELFPDEQPLAVDRRIMKSCTVLSVIQPLLLTVQSFTLLPIVGELLENPEEPNPVQLWEDRLAHVPNLGELLKKTFVEGYSHE